MASQSMVFASYRKGSQSNAGIFLATGECSICFVQRDESHRDGMRRRSEQRGKPAMAYRVFLILTRRAELQGKEYQGKPWQSNADSRFSQVGLPGFCSSNEVAFGRCASQDPVTLLSGNVSRNLPKT